MIGRISIGVKNHVPHSGTCLGLFLLAALCAGMAPTIARGADAPLQALIEGARKEGQLNLMITSSQGEKGAKEMTDAFKARFGLQIAVNADLSGQESQKFNQAVAEIKTGVPPAFDLMQGEPPVVQNLLLAGGLQSIDNWEPLLNQAAPEAYRVKEKISPRGLAGYGFLWATRITTLLYNPKTISETNLPKNWKQMGDAKYKGAFTIPPWTTITLMGILKYDKDEWLDTVKSWGRSKPQVLHYAAAVQRMMLGEIKFLEANTHYYVNEKSKDPSAPIEMRFFDDLTPMRQVFYVVRKGARNPNAAKLFALWVTGEEANRIFEKYSIIENVALGTGPVTRKTMDRLKRQNVTPSTWFDNQKAFDTFSWLRTKEGQEYEKAIARAQREGK
jgi:ABC-type Fe3+ transport system substrate-binding protein